MQRVLFVSYVFAATDVELLPVLTGIALCATVLCFYLLFALQGY